MTFCLLVKMLIKFYLFYKSKNLIISYLNNLPKPNYYSYFMLKQGVFNLFNDYFIKTFHLNIYSYSQM